MATHIHDAAAPATYGFLNWFTGNGQYHNLRQCMNGDHLWIAITVTLDLAVAAGYVLIALHWSRNERGLPDIPAKKALRTMRNIFAFCGVCGYLFIPIKVFWPAWRLYDIFMVFLVWFTWRYALNVRNLKVVYNEIGRSHKLQEDLTKSREESQRKSFFLNAISHDLRTPLNGLLLQANLAEIGMAASDQETVRQAVNDIKASARATATLLDSFLEFARLEAGAEPNHLSDFDLASVVRNAVSAGNALAIEKGLFLKGQSAGGIIIRNDRTKLERILTNLVNNAIKFTQVGGVRIDVERTGMSVQLHVIDTGIGISPEQQERLFDEFYQVNNGERCRTKGFGLGLAIAQRLAEQLGGEITLQSGLGAGSRFSVVLPNCVQSTAEPSVARIQAAVV